MIRRMCGQARNRWNRWTRSFVPRLLIATVSASLRYRVTSLAGEAAFFALMSLPPLLLGLVGTLGYLVGILGHGTVSRVEQTVVQAASTVLSSQSVAEIVQPTLQSVLTTGQAGIVWIGFLIALWSGSRALNVYIDTITVLYGLVGARGVVRQRLLSLLLYTVGLVIGVALLPLMVVGPGIIVGLLPGLGALVYWLYWSTIVVLSIGFLNTLYYLSVPARTPWREHLPGAALALLMWILGSFLLRIYLRLTIETNPLYGSLSAPIAVLLWMYVTALAVLLGATVNAELDHLYPRRKTARARAAAEAELPDPPPSGVT